MENMIKYEKLELISYRFYEKTSLCSGVVLDTEV